MCAVMAYKCGFLDGLFVRRQSVPYHHRGGRPRGCLVCAGYIEDSLDVLHVCDVLRRGHATSTNSLLIEAAMSHVLRPHEYRRARIRWELRRTTYPSPCTAPLACPFAGPSPSSL